MTTDEEDILSDKVPPAWSQAGMTVFSNLRAIGRVVRDLEKRMREQEKQSAIIATRISTAVGLLSAALNYWMNHKP